MSRKRKMVAFLCMALVFMVQVCVVFAADYESIQNGSIGNCNVVARNKITENKKYAEAETTISGSQYGTSTSVSATFYYIGVSGGVVGVTGSFQGGNVGQYGCNYHKNVPSDDYEFTRAESTHHAYYQQAEFYVPNLVTVSIP